MKALTLILRGARFYWRTHLGVVLGAALATMVLTGSLLTGDAVKATLRRQAELRVGRAEMAMTSGDRFFNAALGSAEQSNGAGLPAVWSAPVLMLRATVARADGGARVNMAQLLGVQELFWKQSPGHTQVEIPPDSVGLNARLALQLGVSVGDTLILRVEKLGMFSKDAPLSGEGNEVMAIRVKFARLVTEAEFGSFALNPSQVPPFTAFMRFGDLQKQLGPPTDANLLLITALHVYPNYGRRLPRNLHAAWDFLKDSIKFEKPPDLEKIWKRRQAGLFKSLSTSELSLEVRELKDRTIELRTPRVFLDPPVVEAAPRGKDDRRVDSLTYFVNAIEAAGEIGNLRSTPYSIVTAIETASSGFLPAELADGEIVISQWLADDLRIGAGAKVRLKYFVMGERRELVEKSREFTVLAVLPMDEPQLNGSWMPDFPGLKDAKNCREWKPGFDIDMTKMRAKDNDYWEKYRGTPKAFVNLKVGQEMWGNRWGNVTSMRWPAGTDRGEIERELRAKLSPEQLGFQFIPLRAQALAATDAPVDFGELFVYFSFFLIAAAAVLTGMLFTFSLAQRNAEAGLLLALGLPAKQVRRLFIAEGAVLALAGGVLGICGAVLYTKLVLRALATVWRGAVGTTDFVFEMNGATLVIGLVSGVLIALLAMWWASRRQLRRSARELLTDTASDETPVPDRKGRRATNLLSFANALFILGALLIPALSRGSPLAFFCSGTFLLIAGILGCRYLLRRIAWVRPDPDMPGLQSLGVRNAARRRGRSLGIIGVLASGVFMVVAVDAFRQRPAGETARRDTGTGGFALVGESALPIYDDLNTAKGREAFALDDKIMEGVSVVPMRVREGDDASCLNLNRALQPRLLGVKAEEFEKRGAFRFAGASDWKILDDAQGMAPAVVDETTLEYALQKKLGDALTYRDERGQEFPVRLAAALGGSLLQGSILISERRFIERFPNIGGYRFFLIDCPREKIAQVREHLSRQLSDRGLELTPAAQRLAEFQAVENTYLSIFQALGGLGLLLGSAGLAIVVARSVLERRREFGLLEAVGFRQRQLRALVFAEHRWLIVCGLVIGTLSAVFAVWPGLRERAGGFPFAEMAVLLCALTLGCFFWAWLATRVALRGSGMAALRSE